MAYGERRRRRHITPRALRYHIDSTVYIDSINIVPPSLLQPDADALAKGLSTLYKKPSDGGAFNFTQLGRDVALYCLDLPVLSFMVGPISSAKEKMKKARDPAAAKEARDRKLAAKEMQNAALEDAQEVTQNDMAAAEAAGAWHCYLGDELTIYMCDFAIQGRQ